MTHPPHTGTTSTRRTTGLADLLLALCAFSAALLVRILSWPAVFTDQGTRLVGPDAHYHLRRILWTVENFPEVLKRDFYVGFPAGGEPIWTPFFEQAIAWIAWLGVGPGHPQAVERLAVWVPPLLGATTVAATYLMGQRYFGRRVGGIAAAFVCLLPAPLHYSQIGFVDHHAAAALAVAGLLAAQLSFASPQRPGLGAAIVTGIAIGASLLVWPGTLLQVALVQAWMLVAVVSANDATSACRRAGDATVAHGTAFLLVAPFAIGRTWTVWGDASPVVLSNFQPLWLGLPTLGFGACALAWRSASSVPTGRRAAFLAATVVAPLVATLSLPNMRGGIEDALAWFFRDESFQAVVAESLPLFSRDGSFTLQPAQRILTPLFYALPVMLYLLVTTRRRRNSHRIVALWCAVSFAATVAQQRFANSLAVPWALAIACSLDLVFRALENRASALRWTLALAATLAGLVVFTPLVVPLLRAGSTSERALSGEDVFAREAVSGHESLVAAGSWLADHSPPTAGWLSPGDRPAYGVLTAWGDGHVLRYVAQRPTVQDNFGDDVGDEGFEAAERYFAAASERPALEIARAQQIRYVLVREAGSGHAPEPYAARSMLVRLHRLRGTAESLRQEGSPVFVPALSHHRLIYESPVQGREPGRFKLYEIVAGARVAGTAPAGEVVEATLDLQGENGQRFQYRTYDRSDGQGRYELRLPYPTEGFASQFSAASPYTLRSGGAVAPLALGEETVRAGNRIEGPALVP